ncbi:carbohydrate kinase family protein [Haloactinospora alba]|uniref:hypothetical protein n=1 Tax=Haloactinospora alba TaxID=405555 RepID=UPI001B873208|nr:hypothetical protein [Haloactinospora alba]
MTTATWSRRRSPVLAITELDGDGRAERTFRARGTADWQWDADELPAPLSPDVSALHAGSLATALSPGAEVLEEWLAGRRGEAPVGTDPNIRPSLAGGREREVARVERQLALVGLIKVSAGDLRWLYPGRPVLESARRWAGLGPYLVFLIRGREEAVALRGGGTPLTVS